MRRLQPFKFYHANKQYALIKSVFWGYACFVNEDDVLTIKSMERGFIHR